MPLHIGARPPKPTARCPVCKRKYVLTGEPWNDDTKCAACQYEEWERQDDEQSRAYWQSKSHRSSGVCEFCETPLPPDWNSRFCEDPECVKKRRKAIHDRYIEGLKKE